MSKKGFTIVELVIVIAVIAILAAVLIPTMTTVVDRAHRTADMARLRWLNDEIMLGELTADDIADEKLETKGWELRYHTKSNKLVIVDSEGIVKESFNGELNGEDTKENEQYKKMDELSGAIGGEKEPTEQGKQQEEWGKAEKVEGELPTDEEERNELLSKEEVYLDKVKNIPDNYFKGSQIERIYIGEIERIGDHAFDECSKLKEVIGTAKEIGKYAFYECTSLNKIDLTKTETIEDLCFYGCLSIAEVEMPKIEKMTDNAFNGDKIERLRLKPCKLIESVMTPEFKVKRMEIESGMIYDEFSSFIISLIEYNKEETWTIVVKGITLEEEKEITPFKNVGDNVTLIMDQESYDLLKAEAKKPSDPRYEDPFNGKKVVIE